MRAAGARIAHRPGSSHACHLFVTAHGESVGRFPAVETYVVRVWLPDRPGALGQVASRIGAVRGDVIGIEILERGGGNAIDELMVSLPDGELVDLLVSEIRQVDGVAVEDVRRVAPGRPDPGTAALELSVRLAESPGEGRLTMFCEQLRFLVDGDWCVALSLAGDAPLATSGAVPELGWLSAFFAGSRHLDGTSNGAPGDIAWAYIDRAGAAVATGRAGRPFHARERLEVSLLARIVDALV